MLLEMSSKEVSEWQAYFSIKKRKMEEEQKKNSNKSKGKGLSTFE
jgi:hypothetical protein